MKTLVTLFSLLTINTAKAYHCDQFETQLIAKGTETVTESGICVGKLTKVIDYKPSILCPVLLEDIYRSGVTLDEAQCELTKESGRISGIVISSQGTLILE